MSPGAKQVVRDELKGWFKRDLREWWGKHGDAMARLGASETYLAAKHLRNGDSRSAYRLLLHNSSATEWAALRRETTGQFNSVAESRAEMVDALLDLTKRGAKLLGRILMMALGV